MKTRAALLRARARRRSSGAALFIVAVTLALLAAMGVYGLSATAYDVRAAGHGRQAAQSQHAAEAAIIMTSQVLGPSNAQLLVNRMRADASVRGATTGKQVCKTARPFNMSDAAEATANRDAQACLVLTPTTMGPLVQPSGVWPTTEKSSTTTPSVPIPIPFQPDSFGEVPNYPFIRVELTNPVDTPAPAGNAVGGPSPIFTQVRATVFVEMRHTQNARAESISVGRGRLVVGPYTP